MFFKQAGRKSVTVLESPGSGHFLDTSHWEETPGQTQNFLKSEVPDQNRPQSPVWPVTLQKLMFSFGSVPSRSKRRSFFTCIRSLSF